MMTPELFAEKLKHVKAKGILSIILYGSAAAGDHAGKRSDYNILVVTEALDVEALLAFSSEVAAWVKKKNPPPLWLTRDQLASSADVFPIEWLDMKDHHKVLHGEDVLSSLHVERTHLRLQVEHELKGRLFQLKSRLLLTHGKSTALFELMTQSVSSFLVLFKAALRLRQKEIPASKLEAVKALRGHLEFDVDIFEILSGWKAGGLPPKGVPMLNLFRKYLENIERIVQAVDRMT
ncbi:MAG: nucleotidyltransferase domain-containing protein [Lentisphaerota bacterium]